MENTVIDWEAIALSAGVEPDMDQIRAQIACHTLLVTTLQMIDGGRASKARPLFTDDGIHTFNDASFAGNALTAFLTAREAQVERRTRHRVSNLTFALLAPDQAAATAIVVVYALSAERDADRRVPHAILDFTDRYVRDAGRWKIARRDAKVIAGGG